MLSQEQSFLFHDATYAQYDDIHKALHITQCPLSKRKQVLRDEVHEYPELRREMFAGGPQYAECGAVLVVFVQDSDESAFVQLTTHGYVRHTGNAETLFGKADLWVQRIRYHAARQIQGEGLTVPAQRP